MKKFLIKSTVILSIMAMLGSPTAYADDNQNLTDEEIKVGLCLVSHKIAQRAMMYRQHVNGYSKKDAHKELYEEFITSPNIDPKDFSGTFINGYINASLEASYKEPFLTDADEKVEAVMKFGQDFALACIESIKDLQLPSE